MFNLFLMMFLSLPCLKKPIGMIHTTPAAESTQVALQDVLGLLRSEVRNVFFLGGEVVTQPGLNATKTITRYTSIAILLLMLVLLCWYGRLLILLL